MFNYILKRVLLFIPTLIVISLAAFALSKVAPGDPVELRLSGGMQSGQAGQSSEFLAGERAYQEKAEELGFDKPTFYFKVQAVSYPDTLYRIPKNAHRETLDRLIYDYGNWEEISNYYHSIRALELALFGTEITTDDDAYAGQNTIRDRVGQLYLKYNDKEIESFLSDINAAVNQYPKLASLSDEVDALTANYAAVKSEATPFKNYIPKFSWYGFDNQYHNWLKNLVQPKFYLDFSKSLFEKGFLNFELKFDFGNSILDDRAVWSKIKDALPWTLAINLLAILVAYLISIPLGVVQAVNKDKFWDRFSTTISFALYSLPNFWIAVLLLVFLTTPEYGEWSDLFDVGLPKFDAETPFFPLFNSDFAVLDTKFIIALPVLFLPVVCSTYRSFAFISRQMRGGLIDVIKQDYIRTAKAKGLPFQQIIWKHAFRNSLIPIITMFAVLFPAAIAGSIVIEMIFNIPGMGKLFIDSITSRDWPVVFTIMMFSAILTLVGNLVADFMYTIVDPRISFTKK